MSKVDEKKSKIAEKIERIKARAFLSAESKERLPQPMFWFSLHQQLQSIRDEKLSKRELEELLEE